MAWVPTRRQSDMGPVPKAIRTGGLYLNHQAAIAAKIPAARYQERIGTLAVAPVTAKPCDIPIEPYPWTWRRMGPTLPVIAAATNCSAPPLPAPPSCRLPT